MGRELRRKQAKRERKSLQKEVVSEENQIKKLIKITLLIVFIVCVIYLIAALFITKEVNWFDKEDKSETLVTNTILASETFKQKEEEYYVYFYDYSEEDSEITSAVSSKLSTKKVYKVDTSSALNNNYVSEESNKSAKKLEDLKVKASTVIKISGEEIVEYYEDKEIVNNLK
ncbi:MAG: hypothetical protein IJE89_00770 [Bacilli bacterium]|nr:hypothetical protein [Bacilli bacterium]